VPSGLADVSYELVDSDGEAGAEEELDAGESAAIAVATERDIVLLPDDLAARRFASDGGIEVHGSVGIIALAHGRGRLDADEATARMGALQRETSPFVTEAVIERGIEPLSEER